MMVNIIHSLREIFFFLYTSINKVFSVAAAGFKRSM